MLNLPKLSIAAKLYVIFALLATVTLVLAAVATISARNNAELTEEFGTAFRAAHHVEEINGLLYAIGMETRGINSSPDIATAKPFVESLVRHAGRLAKVMELWKKIVGPEDIDRYRDFSTRMEKYHESGREKIRLALEVGPQAAREYGARTSARMVSETFHNDIGVYPGFIRRGRNASTKK